jgi:hypothetical protein
MRKVGRLTNRQVQTAREAGTLADGGGLYLQVSIGREGNVRKSWVFRYEFRGVRHEIGLGPLHTVTLADARAKARALRLQILEGIDPFAAKQNAKREEMERQAERAKAVTGRTPSIAGNGAPASSKTPCPFSATSPLMTLGHRTSSAC